MVWFCVEDSTAFEGNPDRYGKKISFKLHADNIPAQIKLKTPVLQGHGTNSLDNALHAKFLCILFGW